MRVALTPPETATRVDSRFARVTIRNARGVSFTRITSTASVAIANARLPMLVPRALSVTLPRHRTRAPQRTTTGAECVRVTTTERETIDSVAFAVPNPTTAAGSKRSLVVPSPSWPAAFDPQHRTAAELVTAQVWKLPAEIEVTPVRPATATGADVSLLVPSPS